MGDFKAQIYDPEAVTDAVDDIEMRIDIETYVRNLAREEIILGGGSGSGGNPGITTFITSVNMSADRVVTTDSTGQLVLADPNTVTQINAIAGITTQAGNAGALINVRYEGKHTEPSWNWLAQKPLFLGVGGQLTQTVPTTGLMVIMGWAIDTTSIFVNIQNRVRRI